MLRYFGRGGLPHYGIAVQIPKIISPESRLCALQNQGLLFGQKREAKGVEFYGERGKYSAQTPEKDLLLLFQKAL